MDNKNRDGVLGPPPIENDEISFKTINPLDISFKEFMPGQIIQSGQFNDDMNDIEEKVNEICDEHNTVAYKLKEHLTYTNNPHKVTAHQTGTYSSREIDEFIQDVKSGNLYDNAITNRVLDDDCVDNRNIIDGSITNSKLDNYIGSQIDISQNISITDRYTKEETDLLIQEKVGDGTYDKETIDEKLEQIQAGQILDKSIDIHQIKDSVGTLLDISQNQSIIDRYTREEVDTLIVNNALPRDWGSINDEDDYEPPTSTPGTNVTLPIANHMVANMCIVPETPVLDIEVKENVDAREGCVSIDERLDNIDLCISGISKKQVLNFADFGIPNDSSVDNTPFLKKALDELNKVGGTLIIPEGIWTFKTPLIYDKWLFGCNIVGTGRGCQNFETTDYIKKSSFGTLLNYNGDGFFLTFNGKMNTVSFSNFGVKLDDENSCFIQLNYTFHRGILRDINVSGGRGCIELNTGTYVSIDGIRYSTGSPNAEFGVIIGNKDVVYTTEFIYIDKCSFDFGKCSSGNGIVIYKCSGGVWLSRLDICNSYGVGFLLDNKYGKSVNYFCLRDVNFSSIGTAIEIIPSTGSVGGVFADNIRHGLINESVDEKFIYIHGNNSHKVSVRVINTYIRSTSTTLNPTYIMHISKCNPDECYFELTSGSKLSAFPSGVYLDDNYIVKDYRIKYAGRLSVDFSTLTSVGVGSNYSDYKIEISPIYYNVWNKKPVILFNSNSIYNIGFIKSEISNNKLFAYIRVPSELTSGIVILYYNVFYDNLITQ